MKPLRHRLALAIFLLGAATISTGCEGDGSDGSAPRIDFPPTPECIRFAGGFPSGFDLLPGAANEAAVVQFTPAVVLGLDLDFQPPILLTDSAIPGFPERSCSRCGGLSLPDSDSDGEADACRSDELGFFCFSPIAGDLHAIDRDLVALSTSSHEGIVLIDPQDGSLRSVDIETPAASADFDPDDWPFWPTPGASFERTGFSTRTCVYGDGLMDSLGDPIGVNVFCDGIRNGFVTGFTAGSAFIGDRLFVATSNLLRSGRAQYAPGTVLVFEFDRSFDPPFVRPDPTASIVMTTGFNPTSVTAYTTPSGRDLALVGLTGMILLGTGPDRVQTESSIDVIDAQSRVLIATIPLGRAGLGFDGLAIDSTGRVALIGASTGRALFGIDLAALDDPMLGLGPEPLPIVLDGSDPTYADARLYDADAPFALPKRSNGPPDSQCATQTSVALSSDTNSGAASDFCDGTLSVLSIQTPLLRTTPLDPATAVVVDRLQVVAAALVNDAIGETRAIDGVRIRPGRPGIDFTGPDVYFTAGLPEGGVCGAFVETP